MNILVTGGAGFIGSALVRFLVNETPNRVLNIDALTYAGNPDSITCADNPRYSFAQVDIRDSVNLSREIQAFRPDVIMHLAAESHVDRSIDGPADFIQTNIVGTYNLLEATRAYWRNLPLAKRSAFRFLHVSTDEVFGDLGEEGRFSETSPYAPSSPYSASKASSDHLVRAWQRTYGLPAIICNCSNNYGPFQFPEKLIPLAILNAIAGRKIPVYGDGSQVRDWLYVEDHVQALYLAATQGMVGETYAIGGESERTNLEVVQEICAALESLVPDKPPGVSDYAELIGFVDDRPGHDRRYAIDTSKILEELGWAPRQSFASGIHQTVAWYLQNEHWWRPIQQGRYRGQRLGLRIKASGDSVQAEVER